MTQRELTEIGPGYQFSRDPGLTRWRLLLAVPVLCFSGGEVRQVPDGPELRGLLDRARERAGM
ncbi:MAG: hypothetical protein ACOY93_07970 [Bacillota bacterium]